jgi:hypothetical protein
MELWKRRQPRRIRVAQDSTKPFLKMLGYHFLISKTFWTLHIILLRERPSQPFSSTGLYPITANRMPLPFHVRARDGKQHLETLHKIITLCQKAPGRVRPACLAHSQATKRAGVRPNLLAVRRGRVSNGTACIIYLTCRHSGDDGMMSLKSVLVFGFSDKKNARLRREVPASCRLGHFSEGGRRAVPYLVR